MDKWHHTAVVRSVKWEINMQWKACVQVKYIISLDRWLIGLFTCIFILNLGPTIVGQNITKHLAAIIVTLFCEALLCVAASLTMGNPHYGEKTTKAITMKVFIISFETNPHILAKFQTDRFRTLDENRAGKKIMPSKPHTIAATTLCYIDTAALIIILVIILYCAE